MDNISVYIVIGYSVFIWALFVYQTFFRPQLAEWLNCLRKPVLKYLVYPSLIRHHRYTGRWSRADGLIIAFYLAVNLFCLCFKASSVSSAGLRAANLSLANMSILYASPYLGFLTNVLGLSLTTVRRLHLLAGVMTLLLLAMHLFSLAISGQLLSINVENYLWAIISASSWGFLCVISVLRKRLYEIYISFHQLTAILAAYGLWVHIQPLTPLSRSLLYISICFGISVALLYFSLLFYRNGLWRGRFPKAFIKKSDNTVLISLKLPFPVNIKAGQFVSLWLCIPSIRLHSCAQWHPFVVTSWSDSGQNTLDLFVQPRKGLTQDLLLWDARSCFALFSGPHGMSVSASSYDVVLMVAEGFGIAAHLPYLTQIVHEYNSRKACTRRVHLVWQLETLETAVAFEPLLNKALRNDTLDDGKILEITLWVEHLQNTYKLGSRATIKEGIAKWKPIIQQETNGVNIRKVQEESSSRGRMIVMISASTGIKNKLRDIFYDSIDEDVTLVELEYQPS